MLEFLRMRAILFLMAVLVAPVMGDDFDDYIAAVYGGKGEFVRAGNTYVGSHDIITKAGNAYVSSRGIATKTGNTYFSEDNRAVIKAGNSFVSDRDIITKAGSAYSGRNGITINVGSYLDKP